MPSGTGVSAGEPVGRHEGTTQPGTLCTRSTAGRHSEKDLDIAKTIFGISGLFRHTFQDVGEWLTTCHTTSHCLPALQRTIRVRGMQLLTELYKGRPTPRRRTMRQWRRCCTLVFGIVWNALGASIRLQLRAPRTHSPVAALIFTRPFAATLADNATWCAMMSVTLRRLSDVYDLSTSCLSTMCFSFSHRGNGVRQRL